MVDFRKENEINDLIQAAKKVIADSGRVSMSDSGGARRVQYQLGRWLHDARAEVVVLRAEVARLSQALAAKPIEDPRLAMMDVLSLSLMPFSQVADAIEFYLANDCPQNLTWPRPGRKTCRSGAPDPVTLTQADFMLARQTLATLRSLTTPRLGRLDAAQAEDPKPRRIVCPSCDSGFHVVLSNCQPMVGERGEIEERSWDAHCTGCGWRWSYIEDLNLPTPLQVGEAIERPMPGEEEFGPDQPEAGSGGEA